MKKFKMLRVSSQASRLSLQCWNYSYINGYSSCKQGEFSFTETTVKCTVYHNGNELTAFHARSMM